MAGRLLPDEGVTGRSTWTSGVTPAIASAVAALGAVVLAAGVVRCRGRRSVGLAVAGAAVVVAGVATLLIDRYAPTPAGAVAYVSVGATASVPPIGFSTPCPTRRPG